MIRRRFPIAMVLILLAAVCFPNGYTASLAESGGEQPTAAFAEEAERPDEGDDEQLPFSDGWTASEDGEEYEPVALFLTNILKAQDGMGTYRYTLALPTDDTLNEKDPQYAAMGMLTRRLIDLDGSLGDPEDASPLSDVAATVDAGYVDAYAVYLSNGAIHIYRNGEEIKAEPVSGHFTGVIYTKNARSIPALRYTRKDGTTALVQFSPYCVALFTGEYEHLSISSSMTGMPVALGGGCAVEKLTVNAKMIMHNSGLVEELEYSPAGIDMIGIAYDADEKPITLDSGAWVAGPRPARGRWCYVCGKEYNGLKSNQRELHEIHVCEHIDCKYGGFWASCAPEGSLYNPALHGPSPLCPYGLCSVCSDTLCPLCAMERPGGGSSGVSSNWDLNVFFGR